MLRVLRILPSNVLYMGFIQQRLTCLSFGILELWAVAAAGPHSCGFRKSWVGMDRLTLCSWRAEQEPLGGQVPTGRPGRGCRWCLKS